MADETKKYLDYDGLKHLVEKLTDRIEASGGGDYLPLSGGTIDGNLNVRGDATLPNLAENADAPNIVVADDAGTLYKAPKSEVGGSGVTPSGLYAAYTDADGWNRVMAADDYTAAGGSLPSGATLRGYLIVEGGRSILIPSYLSLYSSSYNYSINTPDGVITASSFSEATQDLDGRLNTRAWLDAGCTASNTPSGACRSFTGGGIPAGRWWVPSLGELQLISRYAERYNALPKGETPSLMIGSPYVSSTAAGTDTAWCSELDGSGDARNREGAYYVLPVTDFAWLTD